MEDIREGEHYMRRPQSLRHNRQHASACSKMASPRFRRKGTVTRSEKCKACGSDYRRREQGVFFFRFVYTMAALIIAQGFCRWAHHCRSASLCCNIKGSFLNCRSANISCSSRRRHTVRADMSQILINLTPQLRVRV
ncbi:hypothetical protein TNCV_3819311 [Trichonephila clavipes]|nr:hypothetical protein TNCV_3819311 [Trichonephila clavipes]